ncbi:uncharacterized protein LOC130769922 isoform X2 [Actinidia eriantha]|uniref:uncharacterized protein LOC130769922 isoform X2 n=1 Tax=Actinidia eriantha TaxID=165200 RepID=UPI002583D812|nr:uncharacterized protein LOC130769922 isoform X2 [Actinidia eriantha]
MAIALRAASAETTASFWRVSIGFLRNLSASSTPNATASASANPNSASSSSKKTKRRKKKNLFEVAQFLPNWGIGYHMAKTHWTNVSYEITRINLYKDGRHGKAWGLAYKDGLEMNGKVDWKLRVEVTWESGKLQRVQIRQRFTCRCS